MKESDRSTSYQSSSTPGTDGTSPPSHASPETVERENEYERSQAELVNNMNRVRVTDCYSRYFGPASTFHLVSTALSTQANGEELRGDPTRQPEVYQRYHENIESLGWDIMPVRAPSVEIARSN